MRTTYEEDEEELEAADHESGRESGRELNLSSTTLLAIFFGIVLICGLFFGFGYTLGRRAPSEAMTAEPVAVQAATAPIGSQPKPSAAQSGTAPKVESTPAPEDPQPTADTSVSDTPQPVPAPQVKPAAATQSQPAETVKTSPQVKLALTPASQIVTPSGQPAASSTAQIMVQIAAVSNAADADVLVTALHKHGYTASARHEPKDALIHVQIGPFASKAEALAMRQKLQSDGYNAILK